MYIDIYDIYLIYMYYIYTHTHAFIIQLSDIHIS